MTIEATPALPKPRIDIALAFKGGWRTFAADIVPLVVGGLIALALSLVTLGILAGPLFAGLYKMTTGRIRDGHRPEIGDVFSCMDRFWSFFVAALVLFVLIGLASLTIVGGVILATIWVYVFPLMVDRGMGFEEALKTSYHMVVDNGFWEHIGLMLLLTALNAVADGPLALLSVPFTIATVTAAYFAVSGRADAVERV